MYLTAGKIFSQCTIPENQKLNMSKSIVLFFRSGSMKVYVYLGLTPFSTEIFRSITMDNKLMYTSNDLG